jgi:hypothetical protein
MSNLSLEDDDEYEEISFYDYDRMFKDWYYDSSNLNKNKISTEMDKELGIKHLCIQGNPSRVFVKKVSKNRFLFKIKYGK